MAFPVCLNCRLVFTLAFGFRILNVIGIEIDPVKVQKAEALVRKLSKHKLCSQASDGTMASRIRIKLGNISNVRLVLKWQILLDCSMRLNGCSISLLHTANMNYCAPSFVPLLQMGALPAGATEIYAFFEGFPPMDKRALGLLFKKCPSARVSDCGNVWEGLITAHVP